MRGQRLPRPCKSAPVEERAEEARSDRPGSPGGEEIAEAGARPAEEAREAQRGVEGRARHADVRVGGDQELLGPAHVRPPEKEGGWQARGYDGRHRLLRERAPPRGTGPGGRPRRSVIWFSRATMRCSRTGIPADAFARRTSARAVSRDEAAPPSSRRLNRSNVSWKVARVRRRDLELRVELPQVEIRRRDVRHERELDGPPSLRPISVARYCARAASFRRRTRPHTSSSQEGKRLR